jgi:hypothetical protein
MFEYLVICNCSIALNLAFVVNSIIFSIISANVVVLIIYR